MKNNLTKSNGLELHKVIIVYSVVPDKKNAAIQHTFLNWCALLDGMNKYHDIRPYKLLNTKKGVVYPMTIAIYYLTKLEYAMLNKKNLSDRKDFAGVKTQFRDVRTPRKLKVISIVQSNDGCIIDDIFKSGIL